MAFEEGQEPEDSKIVEVGMEIIEKCRGIPLAIRTIRNVLYFKNPETELFYFKNNKLIKEKVIFYQHSSYNHLPSHLKHCFSYCRLFPKDHRINVRMLVNLWMAQGFITSSNQNQFIEDIGYDNFMDLLWRSFFQEVEKDAWGTITSCKMYDLIHDLAISVAKKDSAILNQNVENLHERVLHVSFDFEVDLSLQFPASLLEQNKIPNSTFREGTNLGNRI